ncbi:MAG TPA: family 1 glycosylhydrolase [Caulobacteraceae bacterium]|jgi:dTDP-4-dehydrorhamnose reductase
MFFKHPRSTQSPIHPYSSGTSELELWGGYECTVNRVRDQWNDQTHFSGHQHRVEDLDLFAGLGMRALRYPALWERISPEQPDEADFGWTDERLPRILGLGMNPILTLSHHGSGPRYTSLVEDSFAPGLARHAAAVAARYPWVGDWTPVNEPLTTARFSALYGYWYPHTKDEALCWVALLNQIDATRLSMREIRKVNPRARLVQTDDLGYCHATAPLQCEADFQNERRWLGWDLLCGMVKPGHPLWERLTSFGLEDRLRAIADNPCPPSVIGVNHYLASERLRDHRVELYPDRAIADREVGRDCAGVDFVDVDAIRNLPSGVLGLPALLEQAWERYRLPLAVTECHNGATREEQARWFVEVWDGVQALRRDGVDIRAVTAWSLLGSHDWNRMVTRFVGHYEVGVYDVRSGTPRPTLMARVLKDLAEGRRPQAPGLEIPGWWRREGRLLRSPAPNRPRFEITRSDGLVEGAQPLLIIGARGPLVRLFTGACEARGLPYLRLAEAPVRALAACSPWAVVDARDWTGVCEEPAQRRGDWSAGAEAFAPPEQLVADCAELGLPCAMFTSAGDFEEVDARLLERGGERLLLARTERVFTPWDRTRFAVRALDALDFGLPVEADPRLTWDETYGPDLVDAVLDFLLDGQAGPTIFAPYESWSQASFVRRLAEVAEADTDLVLARESPIVVNDHPRACDQPGFTPLLAPTESILERFVRESRCARRIGGPAVTRRRDETREQAAFA